MAALTSRKDELLRKWGRSLEAFVARAVMLLGVLVRIISRPVAMRLADLIGDFIHHVVGLRRELVYRSLALTFPDKSPEALRRIATRVYRNIAETFIDVLRFPLIRNLEDVEALVDIDVTPFLNGTDGGKRGAVMLSGHYGNWELMALAFGLKAKPMTIIVKELSNTALDRAMNRFRTLRGNSVVYDAHSVRPGLRLLSENGVLAILGDQSDPSSSVSGEFLGRRASMFQGAAFFALKAKVPLFVGMCRHGDDGRYRVEIQEIDTSGLTICKEDMLLLASRYTRVLEEYIYRWPEEWFWLHNRWKNP
ncbi:lysophospholipid acyltransferase family protein [Chlorobium sp. N1]|uniref:lysophospholipid acyltransferase family protein n=1 Tax=Chlorobium sp. N1 TaxID=2491138 RepID=UPI00103A3CB1|nr:lysophospholipid acyltransferase family protein [Chlorobium sp. N1]TCD48929.1 lipid A biosynthesis acyltransferase [Chlorobium sp. N1]